MCTIQIAEYEDRGGMHGVCTLSNYSEDDQSERTLIEL